MDKLLVVEKVRIHWQRKIYSTLLTLGMASSYWLVLPLQAATPKPREPIQLKENRSINQPITWAELWKNLFGHKQTQGGGRGEMWACAPTPNLFYKNVAVWNNKPLFLWKGNVREIDVSMVASKEKGNLWKHSISESEAKTQITIYDGQPLQPGETYEWQLVGQNSTIVSSKFTTISAEKTQAIANDLNNLETALKASGASAEEIALQRANYFAQHNLWLDVLPEFLSVKEPSPALENIIRELSTKFCKSESPASQH